MTDFQKAHNPKNATIAVFKQKEVRRVWHHERWYFVVEDVVQVLIDSSDVKQYVQRMKQRDEELAKGWVQIVHTLDISTKGGKQKMICADLAGVFRIIQSISSPKAKHKSLHPEHNLRDHMDDIELILTMLGEATTTRLTQDRDSKKFIKLKQDARDGGSVAGQARLNIEKKTGTKVARKENFLLQPEKIQKLP